MIGKVQNLIERQIQKARLEGQFDYLSGAGKPLPDRPEDAAVDPAVAVGFRAMAQAGVLPAEIEIKKKMLEQQKRMGSLPEGPERREAMVEFARLELRYNIAREARQKFMKE